MTWARIDDKLAFHAKIIRAGNEAVGAWVRMIAHCCAHLTDGLVVREVALAIAPVKVVSRAVEAGLLESSGEDYRIHDFRDWNPPAEHVRSTRLERAEAGRRGAAARWQTDGKPDGNGHGKPDGKRMPNAMANGRQTGWQNDAPLPLPGPKNQEKAERREGSSVQDPAPASAHGVPVSRAREPQNGALQDPEGAARELNFQRTEREPETKSGTRPVAIKKAGFGARLPPTDSGPEIEAERARQLRAAAGFDETPRAKR